MVERDTAGLIDRAKAVLAGNNLGRSTKPAPGLYPHQWNWDSCFIAIGIAHYDCPRAAEELRALLRGQWRNGLIPQIIFNPEGTGYFPGPDVWQSQRSPDAPRDVQTSGITQPPVLATAALHVYQSWDDRVAATGFLREVYPAILRYHEWMYTERNPDGDGLIVVLHPWESGLDNSPPYLDAGKRVHLAYQPKYERLDLLHVAAKNRPTNKDYDLFVYLLEQMRAVDWDQRSYLETAPLQVQDGIFNAVLCRAGEDLAEIARIVGEDPVEPLDWANETRDAVNARLWDDDRGLYFSYDRVAGHRLTDDTIAGFLPLFAGIPDPHRAERLVRGNLLDDSRFAPPSGYAVPTTAMTSPWFNPQNYWLGPVWVNTNWMTMHGLKRYGYEAEARDLRERTLDLVATQGFREYYNPLTGEGYGTDSFSWTAALTIDLLST